MGEDWVKMKDLLRSSLLLLFVCSLFVSRKEKVKLFVVVENVCPCPDSGFINSIKGGSQISTSQNSGNRMNEHHSKTH